MKILNLFIEVGECEDSSEFIEVPVDLKTTNQIKKLMEIKENG